MGSAVSLTKVIRHQLSGELAHLRKSHFHYAHSLNHYVHVSRVHEKEMLMIVGLTVVHCPTPTKILLVYWLMSFTQWGYMKHLPCVRPCVRDCVSSEESVQVCELRQDAKPWRSNIKLGKQKKKRCAVIRWRQGVALCMGPDQLGTLQVFNSEHLNDIQAICLREHAKACLSGERGNQGLEVGTRQVFLLYLPQEERGKRDRQRSITDWYPYILLWWIFILIEFYEDFFNFHCISVSGLSFNHVLFSL